MHGLRSFPRSCTQLVRALGAIGVGVTLLTASPAMAEPPAESAGNSAQDAGAAVSEFFSKVEFSGIVDTYYMYNFNEPTTGSYPENATGVLTRNFDVRHNQFSVALLELAMSRPVAADDRLGFRFDLQYGQVANIFNTDPLDSNNLLNAQQAYVSYLAPVGSGLTLDFGKFVTPIGTEPTEAKDNFNYSRAYMYALGPYYHVGARLGYTINDKVSLGGLIVNGWNATGDNNSGKTFGVSATIKPTSKVTFIQNFLIGPEQTGNSDDIRKLSDTNLAVTLTDKVSTALNYYYGADEVAGSGVSWQGLALYLKAQVNDVFAIAPRFEVYDDKDGFITAAQQALKEFTLTGEFKHPGGLLFRVEYRRDWSDADFFIKNGSPTDHQDSFALAWVYSFSSKAP